MKGDAQSEGTKEVQAAMKELTDNILHIEQHVRELVDVFTPVLSSPRPQSPEVPEETMLFDCTLAREIQTQTCNLATIIDTLSDILNRQQIQ